MLPQSTIPYSKLDQLMKKRAEVTALAQYITNNRNTNVRGVELYGPLAQGGLCPEVHLIICTDRHTANRWLERINHTIRYAPRLLELPPANVRRLQSRLYTGVDLGEVPEGIEGVDPHHIDCLLLPKDWRECTAQLLAFEEHLPENMYPRTMQSLAREALTFVPDQGFPWPLLLH